MRQAWVRSAGASFVADPSGALVWPDRALVVFADLHLEQGSSLARRGTLLPPYDTRTTLRSLETVLRRWAPQRVISLGDGFHDAHASGRLPADDRACLRRLVARHDWIWLVGNHDPCPPEALGGRAEMVVELGGIVFRHIPADRLTGREVAGHLHPVARVTVRGRRLARPCFVSDARRMVLPAFGSYTGGLDVFDPAIAGLFTDGFDVALLGNERVHPLPQARLDRSVRPLQPRPARGSSELSS